MADLNKSYDPAAVEDKWYAEWEARGYFRADETAPGPRFSIVIPPPNVTGVLHMGHVLNNTLQDVLVRFQRMDGYVTPVDAGHRSRRHRHAERGREAARAAKAPTATTSAARRSSSASGRGRNSTAARSSAS